MAARRATFFLAFAALFIHASQAAELVTETLRVPMAAAGPEGLEALLVKPAGPGRHPLAIVSHGAPRLAADRGPMTARGLIRQATVLARRGFIAVSVLRRGYGTSPGGWAESYGPCDDPDYVKAGHAAAADLKATIAYLSRRDDVDATRIVAIGVSAGGFASVALTADPPPGLVAAISFAGGRGNHGSDQVCKDERLVEAFRAFGTRSRIPMLWVYAENDHYFDPLLAHRLYAAFKDSGGRAEFVMAPASGDEGHYIFSSDIETIWVPLADSFLKRQGLLTQRMVPITALDPPRQLNSKGRDDFHTFLEAATHKAFAVSASGAYAWRTAEPTTQAAEHEALDKCQALGHHACRLYAVDGAYAP